MGSRATQSISFSIVGPIERTDLPGLCDRVCGILEESSPSVALCDVAGIEPSAVTLGSQVRLRNASSGLLDLVSFMGLDDVLAC